MPQFTRKTRPREDPRDELVLEADVQKGIIDLLESMWWDVFRVGQYIAAGTQDPGVSDLLCFHDQWGVLFIECKRMKGGVQTTAQKRFQASVERSGNRYLLASSVLTVAKYLNELRRQRRGEKT